MRIITVNSTYDVTITAGGLFEVTKVSAEKASGFNAVGQTRTSRLLSVCVGERAYFDDWATSKIVRVQL